ncbi:MAG: SPFH domain-containing protein [Myxococcota bacterium]|nr:SPFH domain-containing protein [Myxococcota bacterium]
MVFATLGAGQEVELLTAICIAGSIAIGLLFLLAIVRQLLFIGRPNEVLVISGKKRVLSDGSTVGYREVLGGGRTFRIPILEQIESMELTSIPIDIQVKNAYSKGGIPLDVHAVANIKVSSDQEHVANAIERFLGRDPTEIQRVGKETLEGHLRGVLARLTPEEVNEDRLKFASNLVEEADEDFDKLGLTLDTLKIQNVSDDANYLESLGRQRIAEVIRDAEIAESNAVAESKTVEAIAKRNAEVATQNAQAEIIEAENKLREFRAELEASIQAAEEEAKAAAQEARAQAESELQEVRAKLEELRLKADRVLPAEFARQAEELNAAGSAAAIEERGKVMAQVLALMTEAWIRAGSDAKDIFLIHQLEEVMRSVITRLNGMDIAEVNLIDGGNGEALPKYIASFPGAVRQVLEELHSSTGVDVTGILSQKLLSNSDK